MKISIALFTALIAASHHLLVSAADAAVDGATSRPHLRALTDAAVDVACPNNICNTNSGTNQCATGYQCQSVRTVDGSNNGCDGTCVPVACPPSRCNEAGNGCDSGSECDTHAPAETDGCFHCVIHDNEPAPPILQNDEDGSEREATSLRASILEEE